MSNISAFIKSVIKRCCDKNGDGKLERSVLVNGKTYNEVGIFNSAIASYNEKDGTFIADGKEYSVDSVFKSEFEEHVEVPDKTRVRRIPYNQVVWKKSKINNGHYKGGSYLIRILGDFIDIKNKKTGEVTHVYLEKLCKNFPCDQKEELKKYIKDLPAEVILDLSMEASFDSSDKLGNNRSYYSPGKDKIFLASRYRGKYAIVHELGHALDNMGWNSSTKDNSEFMDAYKAELKSFIDAGNEKYEEEYDSEKCAYYHKSGSVENYATWNEREMFAECYSLLMIGDCTCKNCILTYFPKTLAAAQKHLEYIRSQSPEKRHIT